MKRVQKIIALLLAVLITLPTLLTTLSSCEFGSSQGGGDGDSGEGAGSGGDTGGSTGGNTGGSTGGNSGGNSGSGTATPSTKAEYKLTLKTKGGMLLSDVNVYVYALVDGSYEYEDFLVTDGNGVAKIDLDTTKQYAYQPDIEGYDTEEYYPIVSANQVITLESKVISDDIKGQKLKLGSIMYDFEVTTTDGEVFKVSEMLKTHDAVVLNFWFASCGPCQSEFPYMNTVIGEDAYKDKIALLALSWQDNEDEIEAFKNQFELTNIPMAYESPYAASGAGEISGAFSVTGYPTTVVIDRYGVVCLIEKGALTSARAFRIMFDHFIGEDYEQMLVGSLDDITPIETPDVEMPSSDDISDAFDDGSLGDITYTNEKDNIYSWPFIIDEKDGAACVRPSNSRVVASYSQLFFDVELAAGEAIAFDYFASSELGCDILYVIVDGKDIFSISGESTEWQTCYAYVAEAAGTYSVALVYAKDDDTDTGDDTVYLRSLRKCEVADVENQTYIFRYAVKNPDEFGIYQDYAEIVLSSVDGYYHVGSADGPLLLANLMGYTLFSDSKTVYDYASGKSYQQRIVEYCVYASNSTLAGVCPVTAELMDLLKLVVKDAGRMEKDWLKLCHYYDAYCNENNKQLEDPIKGLASFSADDAKLSNKGDTDYPNVITYDRLIVPRGLFKKFTPTESGVYLITSKSNAPVVGWVFKQAGLDDPERPIWYQYEMCNREVIAMDDPDNAYMMLYLEEGVDYYISVALYSVEAMGTVQFRIERIGDAGNGYQLTLASPGAFTYEESTSGQLNKILSGGIEIEFDTESGYWVEKRTDGKTPSYLYADFELCTGIMDNDISLLYLINNGGFDFTKSEDDITILAIYNSKAVTDLLATMKAVRPAATREEACKEYLKTLWGADYTELAETYKIDEVLAGSYHGRVPDARDSEIIDIIRRHDGSCAKADAYLRELWGSDYEDRAEEYKLSEIYDGIYHGAGTDFTLEMKTYIPKMIEAGDVLPDGSVIEAGDARIGTVLVDARLSELLQLLMDKYTFSGVENSWRKLCYYDHTFCEATPF